ncbi:MAG: 3-deoxy-manno-octulosonate cytidylyltransferase [Puniceicoccaceae bacterium]|nr:MAG: 3-deoxy-manno-octulosonate cytidylyltransferase [Puniceicoccaceae bacterium]
MNPPVAIIVPARLASTRFHHKLLHPVKGKPVLLWTAERIRREAPEYPLYFAVDDARLETVLKDAGFEALRTSADHPSGTDRIAEANRTIGAEVIINVQADEPMVTGRQIRSLASLMSEGVQMATLATPLRHDRDLHNPNHVKVVCDDRGFALYFSRAPIPWHRDTSGVFDPAVHGDQGGFIHLGLYAYRRDLLEAFAGWPPGRLEQFEKLEMLRVLERGHRIAVGLSDDALIEIDTPENAAEFERVAVEHFNPEA